MVPGPGGAAVISDTCGRGARHLVTAAAANGALEVRRETVSLGRSLLAEGAAWMPDGSAVLLRSDSGAGWYRLDVASGDLAEAKDIPAMP